MFSGGQRLRWSQRSRLGAAPAYAFTEVLGAKAFPLTGKATGCFSAEAGEHCSNSFALIEVPSGLAAKASGDGVITVWRVRAKIEGAGSVRLVVLRPNADGSYTSAAISEPMVDGTGGPNATSLPIKAGYYIGATTETDGPFGGSDIFGSEGESFATWFEGFTETEQTLMPKPGKYIATELGAEVVLAPEPTSLSPASGPAAGGTLVTIKGKYLANATQVLFGTHPATGLKAEELETLQVTAPAGAAGSTVGVIVVGPGGASPASAAMRFTYPGSAPPSPAPRLPSLSAVSMTNRTFAPGRASTPLTGVTSRAHARGTTFLFTLDQTATASLQISRMLPGRLSGRACVAPRQSLARHARCTRTRAVATPSRSAHAGLNRLPFTGRLNGKALPPGRYRASLLATNAAGPSAPVALAFTIVAR